MRSRTECTMELLSEIDEICRSNRIKYIVGGIPTRAVYENKKLVFPCTDIYVKTRHMKKLIKCLSDLPQNRSLEIKGEKEDVSIYYTDKTTTLIDSYDMCSYENKGMHIHVITTESAGIDRKFLRQSKYYDWRGYKLRMPKAIEAWYNMLFCKDGKYSFPGYPNAYCIVSSTVGYESIVEQMPDWEELCSVMQENSEIVDETTERIDERSVIIDGVMDKVRELYK